MRIRGLRTCLRNLRDGGRVVLRDKDVVEQQVPRRIDRSTPASGQATRIRQGKGYRFASATLRLHHNKTSHAALGLAFRPGCPQHLSTMSTLHLVPVASASVTANRRCSQIKVISLPRFSLDPRQQKSSSHIYHLPASKHTPKTDRPSYCHVGDIKHNPDSSFIQHSGNYLSTPSRPQQVSPHLTFADLRKHASESATSETTLLQLLTSTTSQLVQVVASSPAPSPAPVLPPAPPPRHRPGFDRALHHGFPTSQRRNRDGRRPRRSDRLYKCTPPRLDLDRLPLQPL